MRFTYAFVVACAALALGACSSGGASRAAAPDSGTSTADPRVRSYMGQTPPELGADLSWIIRAPAPLVSLQDRVVFLQFAFPT